MLLSTGSDGTEKLFLGSFLRLTECLPSFFASLNIVTGLFPISLAYIHSVDLVKPLELKLSQCLANVTFDLHK